VARARESFRKCHFGRVLSLRAKHRKWLDHHTPRNEAKTSEHYKCLSRHRDKTSQVRGQMADRGSTLRAMGTTARDRGGRFNPSLTREVHYGNLVEYGRFRGAVGP
jgi:hypothetical protein